MATQEQVYNPTTEPPPKSTKWFIVPTEHLDKVRFAIKCLEVLLSFVAFIMEEVVSSCSDCAPLYFFEFVSCTASLFTLLLLVLLSTVLHKRVGVDCWPKVDIIYTVIIAVLFLIASAVFLAKNEETSLETGAGVFGLLATVLFIIDAVMYCKRSGFTLPARSENGTAEQRAGLPETVKLNAERGE